MTARGRFDVWAPRPSGCGCRVGDERRRRWRAATDGWWSPAGAGAATARSTTATCSTTTTRRCPTRGRGGSRTGVHERSRTFDPTAFAWTDDAWTGRQLAGAVIYELHVGTFTPEGTLDAALEPARPPALDSASTSSS